MIFLHFAKNFRNEEPEPTVFLRFSNFKYRFSRFFQVIRIYVFFGESRGTCR